MLAVPSRAGLLRLPSLNGANRDLAAAMEKISVLERQNSELREASHKKDAVLAQVSHGAINWQSLIFLACFCVGVIV